MPCARNALLPLTRGRKKPRSAAMSRSPSAPGPLAGRRILLIVGGGIAAYKALDLIRRLRDRGAAVRPLLTESAQEFITPLTLQALSGHKVHTQLLDADAEAAKAKVDAEKK